MALPQFKPPPVVPGLRPSERALIEVEWETTQLNATLQAFAARVETGLARLVEEVAFEILGTIQDHWPVDTGRSRASWHVVPPDSQDHYSYQDNEGKTYDGTLDEQTGQLEAVIGTNVNYALPVEARRGVARAALRTHHGDLQQRLSALTKG